MGDINNIAERISPLDAALIKKAQARLDSLTKPLGSLGRLEELARQVVAITGNDRPTFKDKVIFTFASDHGVADEGVSAYPKAVTAQMVYNFMNGGAAINVLARHVGARVVIADLGVAEDVKGKASNALNFVISKIGPGTNNMSKGPAMNRDDAIKSIEAGIDIFNAEHAKGADIIGTGEMGIANTTASSAITAVLTGAEIEEITGRGTGIDDKGLEHKVRIIKRSIDVNRPDPDDAIDVLAKVGGYEIGGLAGVILAAAAKRVPVVIDGFISGAAALLAFCMQPAVKDYIIASHMSVERGHRILLDHIGLKPIFDLNMRLGEGTGAALGINMVEASVKILNEMATFQSASVSTKGC